MRKGGRYLEHYLPIIGDTMTLALGPFQISRVNTCLVINTLRASLRCTMIGVYVQPPTTTPLPNTTHILESFAAVPPVTLCTLS